MKGFKAMGGGPTAGFKFSRSMGFTGSTGDVTSVAPYVRRKAFANGGFVRQDNPRMKAESVGDSGSALVRRSKPTTQLDQESGGRSPLRPGFKRGGYTGGGALGAALASRAKTGQPPVTSGKGKFYDEGGPVRGSSSKGFWSDLRQLPQGLKEGFKALAKREAKTSSGMAKKGADTISGRQKQVDDYVTRAQTGYKRGGKVHADAAQDKPMMEKIAKKAAKRICKADGGEVQKAKTKTMEYRPTPEEAKLTPAQRMQRAHEDSVKRDREYFRKRGDKPLSADDFQLL